MTFPVHPLPSMQGPFEESMLEATGDASRGPFTIPNKSLETRQHLLCRDPDATELAWNFTYNCHWRYRSRGKYHPLLKTQSQIVFGIHLLHQHLEKSVADVADILLKHVNELDSFLKRANEDLDGSLKDMLFRRKCLKVPMEHVNEFDRLLDDRAYRAQLLDGNVVIERTINRMSQVLNDYLVDMSVFREANQELEHYLMTIGHEWTAMNEDVGRIYNAMCGNTGGWAHFLGSLVAKAERLGVVLVQVSSYCNEIEKRCGAASRRSLIASRSSSRNSSNSREARPFRNFANNKPLPTVPNEKPPFITTSAASVGSGSVSLSHSRQASSPLASHARLASETESEDAVSPRQQTAHAGPRNMNPFELAAAPAARADNHSNGDEHTVSWINDASPEKRARDDSAIMLQQDVYKPDGPLHFSDEKEVSLRHDMEEKEVVMHHPLELVKGESSPPLTGKDSAYSSISGGSMASPRTGHHPRSQSAQASYPRAQFGLFPSSQPSTPKHSISSRHGGLSSPSISSPVMAPDQQPYFVPQRSQTSMDNHSSSRRLLRKSSLSSIKRLFSKNKKGSGVDTIVE
ncbi:hypothetical protein DM02DRAFT_644552 [Periconia macrospinosa]|uniref:Uncharacterized protein n=1 Tax=Periconia macrospinosa TaxID=97972 RepID=A0A2V1DF57_9PLEO|nr:hypothetical protein DM02DRAFT_644552 [Periconia macrospinosa]